MSVSSLVKVMFTTLLLGLIYAGLNYQGFTFDTVFDRMAANESFSRIFFISETLQLIFFIIVSLIRLNSCQRLIRFITSVNVLLRTAQS